MGIGELCYNRLKKSYPLYIRTPCVNESNNNGSFHLLSRRLYPLDDQRGFALLSHPACRGLIGIKSPNSAAASAPVHVSMASASKVLEQDPEVLLCLAVDTTLLAAGTCASSRASTSRSGTPTTYSHPPSPSAHPGRQADATPIEVVVVNHDECAAAM
jgi:methylaspartate ammonia-lyase